MGRQSHPPETAARSAFCIVHFRGHARKLPARLADDRQAAAANAIGRGSNGRTVIAIKTAETPIMDDAM
jgi:hypothetical protein